MFGLGRLGKLGSVGRALAAWNNAVLWPLGAASPGMWIDPPYTASLFQDSAGMTAISAIGTVLDTSNPVGLVLDRKGGATVLADPGIHLSQATATSRPVASARSNLLTYSEDFSNAAWSKSAGFTYAKDQIGIDGTLSAFTVSDTSAAEYSGIYQNITNTAATPKTHYYYFLKTTGTPATYPVLEYADGVIDLVTIFNTTTGAFTPFPGSPTFAFSVVSSGLWWKVSATGTSAASGNTAMVVYPALSTDGTTVSDAVTGSCVVCAPQLNLGSTALPYQRVGAASDYDASAGPTYCDLDGTDDGWASAAFTANTAFTAGMDALIAVRRDSTANAVCGLYQSVAEANKVFGIAESGSGSGCVGSGAGTPTVWVDGTQLTGGTAVTRGTLHTALTAGAWHILEFRNLDLSTWTAVGFGLYTSYVLNGGYGGHKVFSNGQDANRALARAQMAAYFGVTLP